MGKKRFAKFLSITTVVLTPQLASADIGDINEARERVRQERHYAKEAQAELHEKRRIHDKAGIRYARKYLKKEKRDLRHARKILHQKKKYTKKYRHRKPHYASSDSNINYPRDYVQYCYNRRNQ